MSEDSFEKVFEQYRNQLDLIEDERKDVLKQGFKLGWKARQEEEEN